MCLPLAVPLSLSCFLLRTQALLVSDFGPKISFRIVDTLREEIRKGRLKSGSEIKVNSVSNALILVDIVIAFVIYFVGCGE